ncbi:uncharacterized protein OCT59_001316 [Rhizophagus irregularis]|nr:hypothetical protein OCT59_001316 [Rhizophagus irregularis]
MVKYLIEWIPYTQFKDLRKIGEGGFSIIYKATWSDGIRNTDVALKKLFNSQKIDLATKEYILIMEYANGGNLHNYLQNNFVNITWKKKSYILEEIISGFKVEFEEAIRNQKWSFENTIEFERSLEEAEKKKLELIQLKKLGPEFSEKPHQRAIYTSRALSSLISKSSINFSSTNSVSIMQEYITKEYELDINKIQSSTTQNINSSVQISNSRHQNFNGPSGSGPLNNLISTETVNSSRKRNIEELEIETQKSKKNRERY